MSDLISRKALIKHLQSLGTSKDNRGRYINPLMLYEILDMIAEQPDARVKEENKIKTKEKIKVAIWTHENGKDKPQLIGTATTEIDRTLQRIAENRELTYLEWLSMNS